MVEKVRVNGVELACELTGKGREPAVFLNGIAMTIVHWKPFAEAFSKAPAEGGLGMACLGHDFRGQILSGRPEGPYTLEGQAEDFAALLDALGMAKVHIVGTSYGSAVGFHFALAHPERVASMVVIDGADAVDPLLRAAVLGWKAAALAEPHAFYRSLIPWTYSAEWIGRNEAFLNDREAAIAGFPRDYFTAFASLCDAFLGLDVAGKLGRITCPSLVLEGGKDILTPGCGRRIADAMGARRFAVMPGAGHAEVVEAPGPLVDEVLAFYRGLGIGNNQEES
jgi:3-oxoadipate enol-lactonase